MQIRYTKFTAKKTKGKWKISTAVYDITKYVSSVEWGGSKDEVARKVSLSFINAPNDPNIKDHRLHRKLLYYSHVPDQ